MTTIRIPKRLAASVALLVTLAVGAVTYAASSDMPAQPVVTGTPSP